MSDDFFNYIVEILKYTWEGNSSGYFAKCPKCLKEDGVSLITGDGLKSSVLVDFSDCQYCQTDMYSYGCQFYDKLAHLYKEMDKKQRREEMEKKMLSEDF